VQRGGPDDRELRLELGPQLRVRGGELQLVHHGLHVEPGAADEHRCAARGPQILDDGPRRPLVGGDRGGLGDVEDAEQVVRNTGTLGRGELGRADVHPPVEGHRVGVDDLAAQGCGNRHAEAGLARRGGPDDGDQRRRATCR
jgi:hypothetical protein